MTSGARVGSMSAYLDVRKRWESTPAYAGALGSDFIRG